MVVGYIADATLAGGRLSKHGEGEYALPGGHLELGESFEHCAERELLEETGIHVSDWTFVHAVNCVFSPTKHYVTIFMAGDVQQVPQCLHAVGSSPPPPTQDTVAHNMEPAKCAGWEWVAWTNVPEPIFLPLQLLMKTHITTDMML